MTSKKCDWLIDRIFEIIEKEDPHLKAWCAEERERRAHYTRFEALHFLAGPNLDVRSLRYISSALGFTYEELKICGKVLSYI